MTEGIDLPAHFTQLVGKATAQVDALLSGTNSQEQKVGHLTLLHAERLRGKTMADWTETWKSSTALAPAVVVPSAVGAYADYARDWTERFVLFVDALRVRGNSYIEREHEGFKPVLVFDYDMVLDGRTFDRPVNYALVRILPPEGFPPQRESGRPFVIIDPRAGHGSGIGGFKSDSEVGVALRDGHPVYFAVFFPEPVAGQTLADVCAAEAVFVQEVLKRHPKAPKPLVTGNCQGGWAAMLMAATNPDLPGPLIIAGAPLSYWAGTSGRNPLRYFGGLTGGQMAATLAADLNDGHFDGANLVLNFEHLNPANTWWRKYYDLFANIDTESHRFLEFERWWSGFYFMNENEIRWIVENLFIGNKLTRGNAVMDDGQRIDLKRITSPIVVFASHGDNITPPEQALFWIADLYDSAKEIMARGQKIIYTIHDTVGHLGIFVSSSVARKQHKQITSTVKTIEALAPGLYEMLIVEGEDRPHVSFEPREISDLLALGSGRDEEQAEFAAVSRFSEWVAETYDLTARPWIRAMSTPALASALTELHPMRQHRVFFSDRNPFFRYWGDVADRVREARTPASADNPFVGIERAQARMIEDGWNLYRDARDAMVELAFHGFYAQPWIKALAKPPPVHPDEHDFRQFPSVRRAIEDATKGGYREAVIRMLILMAHARGSVRRSRLERSNKILQSHAPFSKMSAVERSRLIHEQTLVVEFAPEEATTTLAQLIPDAADRQRAIDLVFEVAGPLKEMTPPTIAMFEQLQFLLDTQASDWEEPEYEVRPFDAKEVVALPDAEAAD